MRIVCVPMDAATFLGGLLAGAAVGGLMAWVLATVRARSVLDPAVNDAQAGQRAATATIEELRGQLVLWRQRGDASDSQVRRLEGEKAAGAARLIEMERGLDEQYRLLEAAKGQMTTTFQAVAAETLQKNSEGFLQLANEKLSAARREGSTELEARQQAIAAMVAPVQQSLDKFDQQVHALEQTRGAAYVLLTEQVRALSDNQKELKAGTDNLVNALRAPAVRGRWGEIQLRRVMEIAGMIDHCDFVEQATVTTADGRLRPDVVVRLPGGKTVVVDAKAPLGAFLAAVDAKTESEKLQHMRQHAEQVRAHVVKLAAKNYWDQFSASPELVVMFLPGDAFYTTALEQMPSLLEDAVANRVLIATPMTLVGVLRAVHVGWKQERLAENAEEISRCGRDLHERLATFTEHIAKMGASLGRTVEAFNEGIGSLEKRVMPAARKLEDLGATGKKELDGVHPIDVRPRVLLASTAGAGGVSLRAIPAPIVAPVAGAAAGDHEPDRVGSRGA
jgi:DNA recombination protein RmuC